MYDWAENQIKLRQAVDEIAAECRVSNLAPTEAAVMARYIRKGGMVRVIPVELTVKAVVVEKPEVETKLGKKKGKK